MDKKFLLNSNVLVETDFDSSAIRCWIEIFYRDVARTLVKSKGTACKIRLIHKEMDKESYRIYFADSNNMIIEALDDLGFAYALIFVSRKYLGVTPFWFWNEQVFDKKQEIPIELKEQQSPPTKIRFRGWFINDEVLIARWSIRGDTELPWKMVFEALVRCRGNMVIPGTDKNSRKYRKIASAMGLWITHHHAEPLGAEMFARAFPKQKPSYPDHKELFRQLWREGIREQQGMNVIWNLGFRGQGDCPFWETDPQYETSRARGELISSIIRIQYDLVQAMTTNPVCCTNLYGEIMELYRDGYLELPEDVIKIWADNGYGKMVSRRQGNNNPRIYALPEPGREKPDGSGHGIYYHVSFYDLQAANHLTMLPNSVEFVVKELEFAFSQGADDFLIVNASNIKPHVYYLDIIRKLWESHSEDVSESVKNHPEEYVNTYFKSACHSSEEDFIKEIAGCYEQYAKCTVPFGFHEDEHAGEQFYNYTTRILASQWMKGDDPTGADELQWAADKKNFKEQIIWYQKLCEDGQERFSGLAKKCEQVYVRLEGPAKQLFEDSIYLQTNIHLYCLKGAVFFCKSFQNFSRKEYLKAFYLMGKAMETYKEADACMRNSEHGIWKGFYQNDCLCDIKQTAHLLKTLMGYIRNIGEGPYFYHWQREYLYPKEDRRVMLITNMENHLTDEELYQCMKGV